MTDKKITALTAASAVYTIDILPIVVKTDSVPETRKITLGTLLTRLPGDVYTEKGSFAVTWNGGGTPPAIGNGTLSAHFTKIGKLIFLSIMMTAGSSTTFGNGVWTFSLPYQVSATGFAVGSVYILDNTTRWYQGISMVDNNSIVVNVYDGNVTIDATHPHTWATNDQLKLTIVYECV